MNMTGGWFHRRHVSTSGIEAFRLGFKFEDNPFPSNTPEHSIWRDEWLDASYAAGRR
jgi:hypothetical protein